MEHHDLHWEACSMVSVALYFISLYFGWAWNNFFTLSLFFSVQFFFWVARQEEHLYLTKNSVSYKFLFYKKSIFPTEFKYQPSIIYDYEKRRSHQPCKLIILKSEKKMMAISDLKWKEDYDAIESFIIEHYDENPYLKNPFLVRLIEGSSALLFFLILGFVMILFGFGLLSENLKITYVSDMKYVESNISNQPEIVTHTRRNSRVKTYSLQFRLKDYPDHKFVLHYRGFKKINGHEFAKQDLVGKEIGFFVDKSEYDHEILDKYTYRYFTSHVEHQDALTITGIFYDGFHILNATEYSKKVENNQHAMSIAFIFFGGAFFVISLYGRKISYN